MTILQGLAIAAGFLSAGFWVWSALVRVVYQGVGGTNRPIAIDRALRKQGRISAVAAGFTALSVLFQAIDQLCR
jgi:hypothetical protein